VTCTPVSCNLTGTYATLSELDVEWDPVLFGPFVVINGGSDTLLSWGITRINQSGTTLSTETIACGGTSPDLCSTFLTQAYTQTLPNSIWDLPSMPHSFSTFTLPNAPDPGDAYVTPIVAALAGLDLANPSGTWPSVYTDAAITWRDHDSDGQLGITSDVTTTGNSSICGGLPYAALPIPSSGALADRIYTGSRTLGGLDGTIESCDVISGDQIGPSNGLPLLSGRIVGCRKVNNGGACTAAETASLDDGADSGQRVLAGRFVMVRAADNLTCQGARDFDYP
jgi:hypothetical protein